MRLDEWLDAEQGRASRLAKHFGLTQGAITQWRGGNTPRSRMDAVSAFTGGEVTVREMVDHLSERITHDVLAQSDQPA